MNQIGLHEEWLEFLENYVMPLQEAAFLGYASEVGLFLLLGDVQLASSLYTLGSIQPSQ